MSLFASSSLFSLPSGSPWSPHLLSLGRTLPSCRLPPWNLSLVFSLLRDPPSDPLSLVSLFGSFPGRSSFCSLWRPLVGLGPFRLSCCWCLPWGLPCSSLPSWFLGEASVFRLSSPSLFSVAVSSGFCGLSSGRAPLVSLSGSGCASLVLLLFLPVLVLSLSLHALLLAPFLRMLSISSSVMSWLEHFLQLVALFLLLLARPTLLSLSFRLSHPRSSLRACGVRGFATSWFFSTVLLWLPSLWHLLDLLLPSFFLLPFRCSVLIVQCL